MKTRLLVLGFAALCLTVTPAMADLWHPPTSPGPLQTALNDLTEGGSTSIDVSGDYISDLADSIWMNTGSGSVATMVIELAEYKATNTFGVYDPMGVDVPLQIFSGILGAGAAKTLYVGAGGQIWLNSMYFPDDTPRPADRTFGSALFGFYLDSTAAGGINNGVWYSETSLNVDSSDHMFAYQGVGDMFHVPGTTGYKPIGDSYYFLAWEDLNGNIGADWNYTDMVVMVESVAPVPVPAAVLLGLLGLSAAGLKLRRFA